MTKLTCKNDRAIKITYKSDDLEVSHKINFADEKDWNSHIESFVEFLRGIGYYIENGEYIPFEEIEPLDVLETE